MSTAETPTPLSPEELERLKAWMAEPADGPSIIPDGMGTIRKGFNRLLSTIDHYKALSTGRVEGLMCGKCHVRSPFKECGSIEGYADPSKCPIRAMVSP